MPWSNYLSIGLKASHFMRKLSVVQAMESIFGLPIGWVSTRCRVVTKGETWKRCNVRRFQDIYSI